MTEEITEKDALDIEDSVQALREAQDICPGCGRAADLLEQLHKENQDLHQLLLQTNQAARYFLDMADQLDALWIDHTLLSLKTDRTKEDAEQLASVLYQIHRLAALRRAASRAKSS